MRCKVVEEKKVKKFEPITIEVTFESEEEVAYYYNALNISYSRVEKLSLEKLSYVAYPVGYRSNSYHLFDVINGVAIKLGLRKESL